ncbi:MAG: class I SAM-dependent methyltransferase [Acidimicrobiales bacterium]
MPLGFLRRRRPPPTHLVVDEPSGPLAIEGGTVLVRGWALAGDTDAGDVEVTAGGQPLRVRRHPRPDVAAAHPGVDQNLLVGFTAVGDRRDLPSDGEISVRAEFSGGQARISDSVDFTNSFGEPVPTQPVDRCPVCSANEREVLGSSDGLRMARCGECTVVYTVDQPEAGFARARYSETYFTDEYLPALEAEAEQMAGHWTLLLDMLEPHRGEASRLFEIGAGAGQFLDVARARGWHVAGLDINAAAVAHGRSRYDLELIEAPADGAIEPGGSYDAVVSEMSLEHVPDPAAVMAGAAEAVRPGGVVMVFTVCPDGDSFSSLGMAAPMVGPAEHLFLFSAASLERLAHDAGLEPLHQWTDDAGDAVGLIARRPSQPA